MTLDEALALADRLPEDPSGIPQAAVVALAVEVHRLRAEHDNAMRTIARMVAEREALEAELAKWRR